MIEILPDSDGNVLGIRATGTVTENDYHTVFNPHVESIINEHGKIKILCMLDEGLPEFEAGQPWEQDNFQLNSKRVLPRVAVVSDSIKIWLGAKVITMAPGTDLKTFSTRRLSQAWEWIRS